MATALQPELVGAADPLAGLVAPPAPMALDPMAPAPSAIELLRQSAPPPFSIELEEFGPAATPHESMMEDLSVPPIVDRDPLIKRALEILYGSDFPLLDPNADGDDWAAWADSLWMRHEGGVQSNLHLVERNRSFRDGVQWISSSGLGRWTEPPKPRDAARVVHNVIRPALDQRVHLVTEQRPGFQTRPATHDPADLKKAQAQQIGLEYEWDQQQMPEVQKELAYWAGTDGVAFVELVWDPERGPWHEAFTANEQGQRIPMGPDGQPAAEPHRFRLGDIRPIVRRVEQVRVSAEATATRKPWYTAIRETIPAAQAVLEYGPEVMKDVEVSTGRFGERLGMQTTPSQRLGYMIPAEDELLEDQETVDRITIYCDRSEFLPKGLHLVAVGQKLVYQGPLLWGVVPVARCTDGTTDPAYFPLAIMNGWVDCQMRMNAILSKWVENVRLNAGARLLAKAKAIKGETLVGGTTMSVIEVAGMGALTENVRPIEGFSLAPDAYRLIEFELKTFEDLSGWNQVSRGQFSSEQSGRAILAIRESLERVFAPPIQAQATFATDWSKITLAAMAWGFDLPRSIGVVGSGRPDLGRALSADDFDGTIDVFVDPEQQMPMPRALKLFLLKELRTSGDMSPQEYRRRLPYAWVRDLGTIDEDHEARARRCVEALRNGQMLPVLWQDNDAIHQDILERELILPDDTPPPLRMAAVQRWTMYANQMQMKQQAMAPMGPVAQPGAGGPPQQGGADGQPGAASGQYGGGDAKGASRESDARSPS